MHVRTNACMNVYVCMCMYACVCMDVVQYWAEPRALVCVFGGAAGLHDLLVPNLRSLVKKGAVGAACRLGTSNLPWPHCVAYKAAVVVSMTRTHRAFLIPLVRIRLLLHSYFHTCSCILNTYSISANSFCIVAY